MPDSSTARIDGLLGEVGGVVGGAVAGTAGALVGGEVGDALDEFLGGGDYSWTVECSGTTTTANTFIEVYEAEYTQTREMVVASASTPSITDISKATNLQEVGICLFGEYEPRQELVTTYYNGQEVSQILSVVDGIQGVDIDYVCTVAIFGIIMSRFLSFPLAMIGRWFS